MKAKNQQAEDYVRTWAGIKPAEEIADDLYLSRSWVVNLAAKLGVSIVLKDCLETRERVKSLVKKYAKIKTKSEIARIAGVPPGTVKWYADKLGIEIKRYKRVLDKPETNSEYFNEHHEGAWLVG